ncbi:hypothetical protein [Paenibacillus sp. PL91]|uniref:hypothetical protein n=1 Tax=Paenibacillus sp. PL91 TaxID=2729538 RepID=UPI00145CE787|nr:hypothetical protein [Paenibacillus sp. PL91]MBC9201177.1 hypothetical protein [Paenibacillus sp. PL91]
MDSIASSNNLPAGLIGISSDAGAVAQDYAKYANTKMISYFDREYLPSGMWEDLCATGAAILAGQSGAIKDGVNVMAQSYKDKLSEQPLIFQIEDE